MFAIETRLIGQIVFCVQFVVFSSRLQGLQQSATSEYQLFGNKVDGREGLIPEQLSDSNPRLKIVNQRYHFYRSC